MKVELVNEIHGGLPEDDDHPYRTGVWRPQYREYDAWDLDVVGEIPDDLAGTYLRNTETAVFEPIKRYHPFDGDGDAALDQLRRWSGPLLEPLRPHRGVRGRAAGRTIAVGRDRRAPVERRPPTTAGAPVR